MSIDRECRVCLTTKPVDQFYTYVVSGRSYLRWYCRSCEAAKGAAHKKSRRAHYSALEAKRRQANPESHKAAKRRFVEKNRAAIAAKRVISYHLDAETSRAKARADYQKHAPARRAKTAAWKLANRSKATLYENNRRARKLSAGGTLSDDVRDRLSILQKGRCAYCRANLAKTGAHLDHIYPLSKGGSNSDGNVQLLCPPCNFSKHNTDPIVFAWRNGRLL